MIKLRIIDQNLNDLEILLYFQKPIVQFIQSFYILIF